MRLSETSAPKPSRLYSDAHYDFTDCRRPDLPGFHSRQQSPPLDLYIKKLYNEHLERGNMEDTKIFIIGRNSHPDGKETAVQIEAGLKPFLAKNNLSMQLIMYKELVFDISNQYIKIIDLNSGLDLANFKLGLMTNWFSHASIRKDMAHTIALYSQKNGQILWNDEALYSRSTSKLSQMMLAALNDITIPRTIFSLSLDNLKNYLQADNFKGPFIFKDAQASRGKSNYLLKDLNEINDYRNEHSEAHPFMVQEFIESKRTDYRFFVAGSQVRLAIKRFGAEGSHLNNTSSGASTELIPIESFKPQIIDLVKKVSEILHRQVTGIDLIFDNVTDQPYFLEANPIPQIATGSNVDAKLEALANAINQAIKRHTV